MLVHYVLQALETSDNLLPDVVAHLLDRNDERRAKRNAQWRQHSAQARHREAAYERFMDVAGSARDQGAERQRSADDDSLEL